MSEQGKKTAYHHRVHLTLADGREQERKVPTWVVAAIQHHGLTVQDAYMLLLRHLAYQRDKLGYASMAELGGEPQGWPVTLRWPGSRRIAREILQVKDPLPGGGVVSHIDGWDVLIRL